MLITLAVVPFYVVLSVAITSYWIIWTVYSRFFHPLSKYPGPFLASLSRAWIVFQVAGAHAEKTQRELHAKYGPIIRIAPNEVAIADPTAIKTIYSISSGFTKTDFYPLFRPSFARYPDLFTNLDEKSHASRRKIVSNLYSMSNIVRSEANIDICTKTLMEKFHVTAERGDAIDLSTWVQWYAFDVIGELFFSRMFGFMAQAADYRGYITALDCLLPMLTIACVMPSYIRPFFLTGGAIFPRILKALMSLKNVETAAKDAVAERSALMKKGEAEGKEDILNSLFEVMETKGEKVDFGLTEIIVEVYVALFAGSDTTAAAISSILYHLMRSPSAYEKLTLEIDNASASGQLSYPLIRYNEAIKLPYLDACCKEGMRLHPSVALTLPRNVPAGGCQISGEFFPAGTRVGINAAVIHRDRNIFGYDADDFIPERWLRADTTIMDRHMFQFGGGARTCVGKNISLCEMYKIVPQILRTYHLSLANGAQDWETHNYWFHKTSGVNTKVQVRNVDEVISKMQGYQPKVDFDLEKTVA